MRIISPIVMFLYLHSGLLMSQSDAYADSLLHLIGTKKPDSTKAKLLDKLVIRYEDLGAFDDAKKYLDSLRVLSEKINYKKGIGQYYAESALIEEYEGDPSASLKTNDQAMKIYSEIGFKKGMAAVYINIGNVYYEIGKLSESIDAQLQAIRLYQSIHDDEGVASCYSNIGNAYRQENDMSQALSYHRKAIAMQLKIDNEQEMGNALSSLATDYYANADYDSAKFFHQQAMLHFQKADYAYGMALSYGNLGNILIAEDLYDSSYYYYKKAFDLFTSIGADGDLSYMENGMATAHLAKNEFKEAKNGFLSAIGHGLRSQDKYILARSYELLSETETKMGDPKDALAHYKLSVAYSDSLNNEDNTKKTVQAQMQYEFDTRSAADSIKNAESTEREKIKHSNEIRQQQLYTWAGVCGFALMLIVAVVSIRAFRNKKKANEIIAHQKELVEEKQKEILDSIHYAKRIQQAQLPSEKNVEKNLSRMKEKPGEFNG
ncbi:MAG TPA: tetratricopeptide repeat protein [Bacteroidia bacterium]|jgi:tetratricopeptide (TPR) repeat protein|nr:tetratricopeptide repeat protein [Bacteroidia bacterium]